ncbi:putative lipid II flippase FtsW [bacterium]|nr:putative lipid II flippase FtsW [bacterium]MBU1635679.1 putative lipid II flippase FtsW [bacterium]MBU1874659.1 putative lipid II flippase FtsW [bacterium]
MKSRYHQSIDQLFFMLTIILIGIGFVIQYSASSSLAAAKFNDPGYYMRGHFIRIIAGFVVGLVFIKLDFNHLKNLAFWFVILSVVMLVLTLILNRSGNSLTARWLQLGPFRFQPSELAKFSVILYLASFYDRHQDEIDDFKKGFLPPVIVMSIIVVLVVIEPDFSTGAVIAFLGIAIMIIAGTKLVYLSPFAGLFVIFSVITIIRSPYKLKRILSAFSGGSDIQGAGYQINQSLITLGNGGFWGRGLAGSVEKNLFLPEPHTDFVFSVAGEEFGFIGAIFLLILFLGLFIRSIQISFRSPTVFGNLLGIGLSISMFSYVLANVGVVTGLLPVTGLPLPFLSYGGSTMLYNFACIGILLNISKTMIEKEKPLRLVTIHG